MLTITNRTRQLLIVAKNSGPSVYLAPGGSAVMPRTEIDGNAKIEKLVKAGSLSVGETTPPSSSEAASETSHDDAPRSKKAKPQKS